MKCPKCQGDVIEIRGNYYCSSCGETVNLEEVKEELEEKIEEAKEQVQADPSHVDGGETLKPVVPEPEKTDSMDQKKENIDESLSNKEHVDRPVSLIQPSANLEKEKSNVDGLKHMAKQNDQETAGPNQKIKSVGKEIGDKAASLKQVFDAKEKIPANSNQYKKAVRLRIMMIAVIVLNILIVAGIIYLLVIK